MFIKSFKQFLAESSWSGYVYHATYDKKFNPKDIKPGIHVGTLHAAMARAASTKGGNNKTNNLTVHAFKFKPDSKKTHLHGTDDGELHANHQGKRINVDHHTDKLHKDGVSHISYKNDAEDPGSTSHYVVDTKNLHHVHSFKAPNFIKHDRIHFAHSHFKPAGF